MHQAESWLNAYQYQTDILLQQQMILHITIFGSGEFQSYTVTNQFIFFHFPVPPEYKFTVVTTDNHQCFLLYSHEFWYKNPYLQKKKFFPTQI